MRIPNSSCNMEIDEPNMSGETKKLTFIRQIWFLSTKIVSLSTKTTIWYWGTNGFYPNYTLLINPKPYLTYNKKRMLSRLNILF